MTDDITPAAGAGMPDLGIDHTDDLFACIPGSGDQGFTVFQELAIPRLFYKIKNAVDIRHDLLVGSKQVVITVYPRRFFIQVPGSHETI